MWEVTPVPAIVVVASVVLAAIYDVRWFRLPNALTLTLLASGLVYHGFSHQPDALGHSLLGVMVGAVPMWLVYVRGGMGAGDVKLMAGVGAWLGAWITLHVLIVAGLLGGAFAAALLWSRRRSQSAELELALQAAPASGMNRIAAQIARPDARRNLVPFGLMIALGVVVTVCLPASFLRPPT
ncbi:MAG: A24 family peptidase [Planctomycetota bacterium]|nr:A24 family peptidase [Planctomycetota bacterium]